MEAHTYTLTRGIDDVLNDVTNEMITKAFTAKIFKMVHCMVTLGTIHVYCICRHISNCLQYVWSQFL